MPEVAAGKDSGVLEGSAQNAAQQATDKMLAQATQVPISNNHLGQTRGVEGDSKPASSEQVKSTSKPWAAAAQAAGLPSVDGGNQSPTKRYDDLHETLIRFTRETLRKSTRLGSTDNGGEDVAASLRVKAEAQSPEDLARLHSSETAFLITVWRRTPYRVGAFPLSLNAGSEDDGTARVKRLDATSGSTWYFLKRNDVRAEFWDFCKDENESESKNKEEEGKAAGG